MNCRKTAEHKSRLTLLSQGYKAAAIISFVLQHNVRIRGQLFFLVSRIDKKARRRILPRS